MQNLLEKVEYYLQVNNISYTKNDFKILAGELHTWDAEKLGERPLYVTLDDTYEQKLSWNRARLQRDMLLKDCDWTQAKDVADAVSSAWAPYRQALRDIPQNFTNPDAIVWPTKP